MGDFKYYKIALVLQYVNKMFVYYYIFYVNLQGEFSRTSEV